MLTRIKSTYREFPREYWILVLANFIDSIGGTMIWPFFALYVTQKFDVGMTEAGILIAIFSISGFIGSMFGGALADKFGRRSLVLFGLVFSALSSLAMGFVNQLYLFYILAVIVGLLSDIAWPARQAMIADLLPEKQRAEGFGVMRVARNLAWIIGPTIGGLLAARSYLILFILDAVTSVITAVIVYKLIPETKPEGTQEQAQESFLSTLSGYRVVFADKIYIAFIFVSMMMLMAYGQIYNTLSVYLRDVHGVPTQGYGVLMSLNATIVVILQFWFTRRLKRFAPMLLMAVGTILYMIGLTMYGVVAVYGLFVAAMVIITFGEMIIMPQGQTLAANFAPEDKRGRYLALFGLSWTIAGAVGPTAAGLIMDNNNPDWVWYAAGIISAIAAAGYYLLYLATKERLAQPTHELEPDLTA
jgi:MFS family permease